MPFSPSPGGSPNISANISGQTVRISGDTVVALISGQTVVASVDVTIPSVTTDISGQTVIAEISGQTLNLTVSGQSLKISGETVLLPSTQEVVARVSGQELALASGLTGTIENIRTITTYIRRNCIPACEYNSSSPYFRSSRSESDKYFWAIRIRDCLRRYHTNSAIPTDTGKHIRTVSVSSLWK